jgi:hypothetical protein
MHSMCDEGIGTAGETAAREMTGLWLHALEKKTGSNPLERSRNSARMFLMANLIWCCR